MADHYPYPFLCSLYDNNRFQNNLNDGIKPILVEPFEQTPEQQAEQQAELRKQAEQQAEQQAERQEQTKLDREARLLEAAIKLRQTEQRIQELQEVSSQLMTTTRPQWCKDNFRSFKSVQGRFSKGWKETLKGFLDGSKRHVEVMDMFLALIVAVTLPNTGLPEIPKGTELCKLPPQTCPFIYRINILIPGRPVYRFKYDVRFDEILPDYSS
jgi:hypothetical protein